MSTYEWDNAKAETNRKKHGIDFAEVLEAFHDPFRIDELDDRSTEERWRSLAIAGEVVLLIVYTFRGDNIRLISARKAKKHEIKQYHHRKI